MTTTKTLGGVIAAITTAIDDKGEPDSARSTALARFQPDGRLHTTAWSSDATIDAALATLGVAAPDDKTFVLTLAHPSSYILDIVALWGTAPMEKKWITSKNATEAANFVSSGPFMMKSWTHQSEIVLVPMLLLVSPHLVPLLVATAAAGIAAVRLRGAQRWWSRVQTSSSRA